MKKLLIIDACIRKEDSRTNRIAKPILDKLITKFDKVDLVDLTSFNLPVINVDIFKERSKGYLPPEILKEAQMIKEADYIVIKCPFWDMSFPAVLKVFLEYCSIPNITFLEVPGGFKGNCKAKEILLITTRGMDLNDEDPLEGGTSFLKALGYLWGIPSVKCISAVGLDVLPILTSEERIISAIKRGLSYVDNLKI